MKLKVKSIDEHGELTCQRPGGFDCKVDLFCGCAEKNIEREELHKIIKPGDFIEIPDDSFIFKPLYLPGEYKLIKHE